MKNGKFSKAFILLINFLEYSQVIYHSDMTRYKFISKKNVDL
jgi:hypothetical protein